MKYLEPTVKLIVSLSFIALIGFSVWHLNSAWPLAALILVPAMQSLQSNNSSDNED